MLKIECVYILIGSIINDHIRQHIIQSNEILSDGPEESKVSLRDTDVVDVPTVVV